VAAGEGAATAGAEPVTTGLGTGSAVETAEVAGAGVVAAAGVAVGAGVGVGVAVGVGVGVGVAATVGAGDGLSASGAFEQEQMETTQSSASVLFMSSVHEPELSERKTK
jgi:hypothetical protein